MPQLVSARTIAAGMFFYSSTFTVPDYQRCYKWGKGEVEEFYRDLQDAKDRDGEYFLGLVITTASDDGGEELVDGQQRLMTLTLLANCLRLEALRCGRDATADNISQTFLYGFEEEDERHISRMSLSDIDDQAALTAALELREPGKVAKTGSGVATAHNQLTELLAESMGKTSNPGTYIASWARWIKAKLLFVWFQHPDASAAYNVFMVVNTRGLDLTASELIKAHLLSISSDKRDVLSRRWVDIESALRDSGGESDAMTAFVRHVHLLDHAYVINKQLFDDVSREYRDPSAVSELFARLEANLPQYLTLLNPLEAEIDGAAFSELAWIMRMLGIKTARPLLLAMSHAGARRVDYEMLSGAMVTRWVTGGISANVDEVAMAAAARAIYLNAGSLEGPLQELCDKFRPDRASVEDALLTRSFRTRNQARVLLCTLEAGNPLPDFRLGNAVARKLYAKAFLSESAEFGGDDDCRLGNWSADDANVSKAGLRQEPEGAIAEIAERSADMADRLVGIWYG